MLGHALKGRRDEFVVATKFGMDMQGANGDDHGVRGSRRYVRRAVEASLRRLQTDHIDLYQLHAPDPVTPIAETLGALTELVREGKVRYIGCSNFDGWQVADAAWTSRDQGPRAVRLGAEPLLAARPRPSRTRWSRPCERFGLGVLPFFPLEYGLLTGKYTPRRGAPDRLPRRPRPEPRGLAGEGRLGPHRGARDVRRGARPVGPRRGHRRPRRAAGRLLGDLGRHPRRAGAHQRRRPALGAHARKSSTPRELSSRSRAEVGGRRVG